MSDAPALDYAASGVDTAAGDRAVELMKSAVTRTHNATVFGGTGGFAGMVDASALLGMTRPLLATSTDGVGTKIALAQAMDVHDTIGQDLVGMVVDDIVVVGARPLLMTDYIACGKVVPERIASIVTGIARACAEVECPLVGGETAEHPLLATSTDGVGTKIALAQAMDVHDTIGQDLVGMVVDDIVVVGARPLLMTDYIACGKVVPERIASIVTGIARACAEVDCPLVGGETAEHPGVMAEDDYDIAGAATGVVDAERILGPARVGEGDVLVGIASSGLHSNGYSLVRKVLEVSGLSLDTQIAEFDRTLGEELLEPTRLYTKLCLDLIAAVGEGELLAPLEGPEADASRAPGMRGAATGIHALSHVTGGGLGANLSRVLPRGVVAEVNRGAWVVPAVFDWVRREGNVSWEALED